MLQAVIAGKNSDDGRVRGSVRNGAPVGIKLRTLILLIFRSNSERNYAFAEVCSPSVIWPLVCRRSECTVFQVDKAAWLRIAQGWLSLISKPRRTATEKFQDAVDRDGTHQKDSDSPH